MKYFLGLIISLFSLVVFSQNNMEEKAKVFRDSNPVFKNYTKEKFFLHTNKTTYFSGEKIWYKVYVVVDDANTPSYLTSNLHFNVYNSDKELVKSELVFVEKGTANGFFEIDSLYKTGSYYLSVNTAYNTNFNSGYIKQIEIVNLETDQPNFNEFGVDEVVDKQDDLDSKLKIAFFPESNTLLSRAYNTLYFKATYNGAPVELRGKIINTETEAELKLIQTNKQGLGVVIFPCYLNKNYVLKTKINEEMFFVSLPKVEEKGFLIHYNVSKTNFKEVFFNISTNNSTNTDYNNGDIIYAVVHRNGFLKSVTPIEIESDINNYALKVAEEGLFDGLNSLSLFNDDNQEVASRNFFFNKNKEVLLSVEAGEETKDSLQLKVEMLNRYQVVNASISVLTEETKMFVDANNIRSEYLLNSYVELPPKSVHKILRQRYVGVESDMLLQTLAKPKMNLQVKHVKADLKPENGLSISGSVVTNIENLNGYKILLTSKKNNIVLFEKLNAKKTFAFNNLLLINKSKYKLALLNPGGVVQEAKFRINPIKPSYQADSILVYKSKIVAKKKPELKAEKQTTNVVVLQNGIEQLDEVALVGSKKKREVIDLDSIGYINNPKELGNGFTQAVKKNDIQCKGCSILEYLDQLPNVRAGFKSIDSISVVFTSRGVNTFLGSKEAHILLDGFPLADDLSTLSDLQADDVESVQLNRSGAGYGSQGASGVINIKLKKMGERSNQSFKVLTTTSQADFGFNTEASSFQYMPLAFSNSRVKQYYDTVDWLPNVDILPNKTNYITIAKEGNDHLKIIINGFNEDGDLLFKEINITAKQIK